VSADHTKKGLKGGWNKPRRFRETKSLSVRAGQELKGGGKKKKGDEDLIKADSVRAGGTLILRISRVPGENISMMIKRLPQ